MVGRKLSHFRVIAKLGEGGMGVVYRAEDESLRRQVALKVLPLERVANEERRLRFLREARAAAALSQPNIATVYEVGEAEGLIFIAMELVEGKSLREVISGRPMPIPRALQAASSIAEGMAHAHQAGVIHRDLKPDNVMIRPDEQIKILDFGLAKLMEESKARDEAPGSDLSKLETLSREMTEAGRVFGTAAYMSPEQARGESVDARGDIFSFGVTLYEMVTGKAPFSGKTNLDTLSAILHKTAAPASGLNPEVPSELERIIEKCLEKEPRERYQRSEELALDLKRLRRKSESGAQGISASGGSGRWSGFGARRGAQLATAAFAVVALVLGALAAFDIAGFRERVARLIAGSAAGTSAASVIDSLVVLPLDNVSGDPGQEYFAHGMTEALISDLSKIGALRVISKTSAMRYKGTSKTLPEIARELDVKGVVEGSVQRSGDRVRITVQLVEGTSDRNLWSDSYEREVRDVLALQGEVARAIAEQIRVKLTAGERERISATRSIDLRAHDAYLKARYQESRGTGEGWRKAAELYKEALRIDPDYGPAHAGLSWAYNWFADFFIAPPREALALARREALRALEIDETLTEAHVSLGWVKYAADWDWAGAEREYRRAIEIDPGYSVAHWVYSEQLVYEGRYEEALGEIRRARELNPVDPLTRVWEILALRASRQYDRALELAREVVRLEPGFPLAWNELGQVCTDMRLYGEAIEAYRKGLELSGDMAFFKRGLGRALASSGNVDGARQVLEELREADRKRYVKPCDPAVVHAALGELDPAMEWLERAFKERDYCLLAARLPEFDPLRPDPRFADLFRRIGFPAR